jgi:hypothetical protein
MIVPDFPTARIAFIFLNFFTLEVKEVFALETPDVTHSTTQSQLQKA